MNGQTKKSLYFTGIEPRQLALELGTDLEKGLSTEEAFARLKQFGPNLLNVHRQRNQWLELLSHFTSPLVLILLIATGISFFMGETINALIILAMVMLSVIIDFFQERDANKAAESLKQQVKNRVMVLREGREMELLPEELCVGDLLLLNAGKVVPADARVVFARDFFLNQSSLTGESFPCEKTPVTLANATEELSSMTNLVFMGSSVSTGTARAIVIHTGSTTQLGKLAAGLVSREPETEFSKGLKDFGYLIMRATLVLVLFIFLVNAVLGRHLLDSFMFSLAVAVGLTPELLPMVMSVTMSIGSGKMARKGVIVKKLAAIPNFGSMEVLCTDKTGTLTEDRIQLIKCVDGEGLDNDAVFEWVYLNSFYQTGVQNPLDDAVLLHRKMDVSATPKIDEIPFDFFRKRMSVVVKSNDRIQLICKGAPEEVFQACELQEERRKKAVEVYEQLSAEGYRVLAIATKNMVGNQAYSKQDECSLELKGFVAFLDPPKQDADDVIRALASIGVEVKIITGDNHLVTKKICQEIGLEVKGVMQGHEMEHLTDDALRQRVKSTTIFTRFSPDQKNRIILALKGNHHAVGYMGDGINDAPSLRTADIGISVSNATDVAKEAADIILTRKDLLVLKEGILEGRKTFGNTMKYILMGLSSNFGNMFSVAAAVLFLPFLPMLPVQILINNFLYDTSQVTIPTDHVDASYTAKPQRWNMRLIRHYMVLFGLTSSLFDLATFYLLYKIYPMGEGVFRTGWFLESLSTQVLVVFVIRTSHWPFLQSLPSSKLVWSTLFCLALGWALPWMPFASQLGFQALPLPLIGWLVLIVLVYLVAAEVVKRYIYNRMEQVPMLLVKPN
jgi:Mg2+-importing ATPase